jgi:hypothetical protein
MARDPENDQEAASEARSARPRGQAGQAGPPAEAPPQAPEQARVKRLNAMGIPAAAAGEAPWSADLFRPTITSLTRGR